MVLQSVKSNSFVIHDPATGKKTVEAKEFSEKFTGVAVELTPTAGFKKEEHKQRLSLSSLWTNSRGLATNIFQIVVATLLIQIFAVATPFYMQTVVDDVLLSSDSNLLKALALGFTLLLVIDVLTCLLYTSPSPRD